MRDGDNDDQLRWALGAFLGGCVALLPFLVGRLDMSTTLVVSAIAAAVILPFWRHAGEALNKPIAIIPLLELVFGPAVIAAFFSGAAIATYIGAWFCALGVMRFVSGWRDPI